MKDIDAKPTIDDAIECLAKGDCTVTLRRNQIIVDATIVIEDFNDLFELKRLLGLCGTK